MSEREPSSKLQQSDGSFLREHPEMARDSLVAYWSGKINRIVPQMGEFVIFDETENDAKGFLDISYQMIKGDIFLKSQDDPIGYHTYNPAEVWGEFNLIKGTREQLIERCPDEKFHDQVHILFTTFSEYARKKALVVLCSDDELEYVFELSEGFSERKSVA